METNALISFQVYIQSISQETAFTYLFYSPKHFVRHSVAHEPSLSLKRLQSDGEALPFLNTYLRVAVWPDVICHAFKSRAVRADLMSVVAQ